MVLISSHLALLQYISPPLSFNVLGVTLNCHDSTCGWSTVRCLEDLDLDLELNPCPPILRSRTKPENYNGHQLTERQIFKKKKTKPNQNKKRNKQKTKQPNNQIASDDNSVSIHNSGALPTQGCFFVFFFSFFLPLFHVNKEQKGFIKYMAMTYFPPCLCFFLHLSASLLSSNCVKIVLDTNLALSSSLTKPKRLISQEVPIP